MRYSLLFLPKEPSMLAGPGGERLAAAVWSGGASRTKPVAGTGQWGSLRWDLSSQDISRRDALVLVWEDWVLATSRDRLVQWLVAKEQESQESRALLGAIWTWDAYRQSEPGGTGCGLATLWVAYDGEAPGLPTGGAPTPLIGYVDDKRFADVFEEEIGVCDFISGLNKLPKLPAHLLPIWTLCVVAQARGLGHFVLQEVS